MTRFVKIIALAAVLGSAGWTAPAFAGDGGAFFGTGLGAALGGLVGSQFGKGGGNTAATIAGVVVGGVIGNSVGQNYDNQQRARYYGGGGYAQPVYYSNYAYEPNYVAPYAPQPRQVVYYEPQPVYREQAPAYVRSGYVGQNNLSSQYCREYTRRVVVGGIVRESYGTACLQPDGAWRIQR